MAPSNSRTLSNLPLPLFRSERLRSIGERRRRLSSRRCCRATIRRASSHRSQTLQSRNARSKHPDSVIRYGRGEQHLFHFNPQLAPQGDIFRDAPWTGMMEDPIKFVSWVYAFVCNKPIPDDEMERVIQEFSYPGTTRAVPRYFNSSSFRQEWLQRRNGLLEAWKCPVMIMQGYDSKSQPREFYVDAREYIPNAKDVKVSFIPGGHFWTLESPQETTVAIQDMLKMPV